MVIPQAVVQRAELQEGGAVVVSQPGGRRQVLDGFLRVSQSDVTIGAELPRLRIPRRDLRSGWQLLYRPGRHVKTNAAQEFRGSLLFHMCDTIE